MKKILILFTVALSFFVLFILYSYININNSVIVRFDYDKETDYQTDDYYADLFPEIKNMENKRIVKYDLSITNKSVFNLKKVDVDFKSEKINNSNMQILGFTKVVDGCLDLKHGNSITKKYYFLVSDSMTDDDIKNEMNSDVFILQFFIFGKKKSISW